MHSGKKLNKEDTWRPAELRRHIREEGPGDDYVRRRDDSERKHRGGESTERRPRDPEKESRREREKYRERESTRERRHEVENDRYADRHKEGSRDRRGDRDRDRRDEREREKRRDRDRLEDGKRADEYYRENRDRRQDREEKHYTERDKERLRDREKEKERDRNRHNGEDREKRREEKERRREEQDREHKSEKERRRYGDTREVQGDMIGKHEREKRERHRERQRHNDENEDERNDRERRERHRDKKHSELKEEREHKEEHRRHKEDRERRHTEEKERRHKEERERRHTEERERRHKEEREKRHNERGSQDERRKHDSESREHRGLKGSNEEDRHHHGDKERERDRHKERRHRERAEEEPERNHHKDRSSSSKKTEKSNRHETKTEEVAPVSVKHVGDSEETEVNAEEQAEQEYEDDFEKVDYEEDFEEMDESANEDEGEKVPQNQGTDGEREELTAQRRKEIEAIQRAMDEENERVGTAQSRSSTSRDEEDEPKWTRGSEKSQSRATHRGKFIDFVAAKQREVSKKVATKQKKRSTALLRLIDLDFSMTFSHLDLPPVNEYDMYIKSFGTTNTKQAYAQCNEDNADRDIQTEEIEVCEKWTQHPPEKSGACGDPNLSQGARDKTTSDLSFDSQRLTAFLHSASQVMVILLEEDQAEKKSLRKLESQTDALSFSDGSLQLNTKLPFLYGRHISLVHFSQVQRYTMMSVHKPTSKPGAVHLDSCTIICIWNIREPSRPQQILVYESEVQCCCFSPGKAILVFAGTSVGSVVLWDLRENTSNHLCSKIAENEWTFRQPTFSTDAVMGGSGHFSSVTSVEVVPSAVAVGLRPEVPFLASEEESSGLSFQLASLDESGVLNFWVVVELPKANEAGSPTDLGLRPGGKVKLLHSSSLLTAERVSPRDAVKTGPSQTLHLKFLPTDSNHFFIGTNMGLVNHGTSHGLKAPPKYYRFQEAGVRPVDITSINFSPFLSHLFLVGCGDGSIRLHTVSHEQPVAEWTNGTAQEPVVSLQWTQTRPTVFCALDTASNLRIWDLMKNDTEPVVTERIHSDRVTAMAVFGDSGQQNTYSGIALAHESGKIELQYFSRNFTVPILAEEDKLKDMMSEAF